MSIFGDLVKQRLERFHTHSSKKSPFGADGSYPAQSWVATSSSGDAGRLNIRASVGGAVIGSVAHGDPVSIVGPIVNGWVPVDLSNTKNASRSGEAGGTSDGSWTNPNGYASAQYLSATPLSSGVAITPAGVTAVVSDAVSAVESGITGGTVTAGLNTMVAGNSKLQTAMKVGFAGLAIGVVGYEANKAGYLDSLKKALKR